MSPTHIVVRSGLDIGSHHVRKKERKIQPRVCLDEIALLKLQAKMLHPLDCTASLPELRSAEREGLVNANNITSLWVSFLRVKSLEGPKLFKINIVELYSHPKWMYTEAREASHEKPP